MFKLLLKLLPGVLVLLFLILLMSGFNSIASHKPDCAQSEDSLATEETEPDTPTQCENSDAIAADQEDPVAQINVDVVPIERLLAAGYRFEGTLLKKGAPDAEGQNDEDAAETKTQDRAIDTGGRTNNQLNGQSLIQRETAANQETSQGGDGGDATESVWAAITEGLIPPLNLENSRQLPAGEIIRTFGLTPVAVTLRPNHPAVRFAVVDLAAVVTSISNGNADQIDPQHVLKNLDRSDRYGNAGIGGEELIDQFFASSGYSYRKLVTSIEQSTDQSNVAIGFMIPLQTETMLKRIQYQAFKSWNSNMPWSEYSLMKGIWVRSNGQINVKIVQMKHKEKGWINI
jgi:hypothetical protein